MNSLVKAIIGGAIGGAIGAAVWAIVAYQFNYEIGYIAWGVGVLVGILARVGAGDDVGQTTGVAAAVIAIAAVCAGKYAAVSAAVDDVVREVNTHVGTMADDDLKIFLADEIVAEFEGQGRTLNWPEGMSVEDATDPEDYPPEVWAEVTSRWENGGPSWQASCREYAQQKIAYDVQAFAATIKGEGFLQSFSPFDFLFFALAVASAYGIASGVGGD